MVAYSFQQQFVAPIQAGAKRQTIRSHRARHARPDEMIQIYCGMRTKHCFKIIPDVRCTRLDDVRIDLRALASEPEPKSTAALEEAASRVSLFVNGIPLTLAAQRDGLAVADGFGGSRWRFGVSPFAAMVLFWMGSHGAINFEGVMISWEPVQ